MQAAWRFSRSFGPFSSKFRRQMSLMRCVRIRLLLLASPESLTVSLSLLNMEDLKLLQNPAKLERDRGIAAVKRYLIDASKEDVSKVEEELLSMLENEENSWENFHGSLSASKFVLTHAHGTENFAAKIHVVVLKLLEHSESRVRVVAGEVLGVLCIRCGARIYSENKEAILSGIRNNLERPPEDKLTDEEISMKNELSEKLHDSKSPAIRRSLSAEDIFHDTAGWKSLETWMLCLQRVVEGCRQSFQPFIDSELLDLIFQALHHTNRFVRETGYYVCGAIVGSAGEEEGKSVLQEGNAVYENGKVFADELGKGLSDNWSQVRLAASVATRSFLQSIPTESARDEFYPVLLPRMCLNRYYVAEGVRIYSQETWKNVTGAVGKQLVEKYIQEVVEYYIAQSDADNHAVREAACACIAELGSKIDPDVVRPYVQRLLEALIICFKDDSWPVRDASCVACGNFILCFADESKDKMPELWPLFFENLQDNIPSVRQGAAVALSSVCKAYSSDAFKIVYEKIKEGLNGVETQADDSERYKGLEKGPAVYGVAKRARDNDIHLHENQTMYSCGSLAPKMGRGSREGGCMDHKFRRPAEPWELADGCVYLLAELGQLQTETQAITKILPVLAKSTTHQHYTNHVHYLETVCKELPIIAKGIGKRFFKMHIELFFDAIFYSHSCDNALTSSAASQCLNSLSSLLGPSILRGRVENFNPKYLQQLDANQYIAAL